MPTIPDRKDAVVLKVRAPDRIIIWIEGNRVWAVSNNSLGALLVGKVDGPIRGISHKHYEFEVVNDAD